MSDRAQDLKYLGLIVSVAAAVGLRFFSDFSFATIQHQADLARLDTSRLSVPDLAALSLNSLSYQLQRDWFNLSPQAPAEVVGLAGFVVVLYLILRQAIAADTAATTVLLLAPVLAVAATVIGCAWVLARVARAA